MAISGVNPKCYILALFVRHDGARFLLGDDPFEFKDNQLHFQQNTMANDVVEVQGNDGYLLAGQVRRPGTQVFDGYVCNGTNSKEEVEVKRRAFLQFFRRSHFYKVIYVFPNGTAIQRKQGFLVDDPTVQELYQQYPEYHVALNFEDVNYYTYEEDDQGHEIYAKEAIVPLARGGATGGLIWDNYGVVWEDPWGLPLSISGKQFQILNNAGAVAPIENTQLQGDTYQQTYTGKNLYQTIGRTTYGLTGTLQSDGRFNVTGTATGTYANITETINPNLPAGTYTFSLTNAIPVRASLRVGSNNVASIAEGNTNATFTTTETTTDMKVWFPSITNGTTYNFTVGFQVEAGSTATAFEPYVGGIPAPNPDYPQAVQAVTGEQTVDTHGIQLLTNMGMATPSTDTTFWYNFTSAAISLTPQDNGWGTIKQLKQTFGNFYVAWGAIKNMATSTTYTLIIELKNVVSQGAGCIDFIQPNQAADPFESFEIIVGGSASTSTVLRTAFGNPDPVTVVKATTKPSATAIGLRFYTRNSTPVGSSFDIRVTVLNGDHSSDWQTYIGDNWQPYQSQSYTISLGSIELCKIGDRQDYIYKGDDGWYLHKEVRHLSLSVSGMNNSESYPGWVGVAELIQDFPANTNVNMNTLTDSWDNITGINLKDSGRLIWGANNRGNGVIYASRSFFGGAWNQTYWTTNYPNLIIELYYGIINTPAGTQITDATLVGQLEALGAMKLFIGENNVLVGATGTNLPATLAFDYYTKFAAIGAEWEEGGTKGATIVDVDAIDNTYPVWELTGPATNPTLSVLTTNTALTYNGTITASQKLVIDMFNKTATLNGTSVIGNISGDFVYMAPGTNRVTYTAGNTDAPDSTIYWQEVVG